MLSGNHAFNRFDRCGTGGHHIFYDNNGAVRRHDFAAFDPLAGAMAFGFFAHDERSAWPVGYEACDRRCGRNRVRAKREPANRDGLGRHVIHHCVYQRTDQKRAFGVQRHLFAVDVKVGLEARRQRDFSLGEREFAQQREQAIMLFGEIGLLPEKGDRFRSTHGLQTTILPVGRGRVGGRGLANRAGVRAVCRLVGPVALTQ